MSRPSDTAIKQAILDLAYMTKQVKDGSNLQFMLSGMANALGWVIEDPAHGPSFDQILVEVRDNLKERHIIPM